MSRNTDGPRIVNTAGRTLHEKLYVGRNDKGHSVFTSQKITKGEIFCNYDGEVCTYKQLQKKKKRIHVV